MATKRVPDKKLVVSPGAAKALSTRKAAPPKRTRSNDAAHQPMAEPAIAAPAIVEPAIPTEAVAALAYSYWVARGCEGGSPEEDWLRAERELRESLPVAAVSKASA
jgi:hypothetical protein